MITGFTIRCEGCPATCVRDALQEDTPLSVVRNPGFLTVTRPSTRRQPSPIPPEPHPDPPFSGRQTPVSVVWNPGFPTLTRPSTRRQLSPIPPEPQPDPPFSGRQTSLSDVTSPKFQLGVDPPAVAWTGSRLKWGWGEATYPTPPGPICFGAGESHPPTPIGTTTNTTTTTNHGTRITTVTASVARRNDLTVERSDPPHPPSHG
jgi:hypothetical protein